MTYNRVQKTTQAAKLKRKTQKEGEREREKKIPKKKGKPKRGKLGAWRS
jgi:hypothetical protein